MNPPRSGTGIPTWVKLGVPGVLFAVAILAGLVVIATREPPECASVAAIEERFAPQLSHLRELVLNHGPDRNSDGDGGGENERNEAPIDAVTIDGVTVDEESIDDARDRIEEILDRKNMWWLDMEIDEELFADPVILGAAIRYCNSDHCATEITVKSFDKPDGGWTVSMRSATPDEPAVTLYSAGSRRWVRFEKIFSNEGGLERGCRLFLDVDLLEREYRERTPAE